MKRFGLILFVLAWLVGCGGEQTAVSPTTTPTLPTATSLPTVAAAPTTAAEPATATPESISVAPATETAVPTPDLVAITATPVAVVPDVERPVLSVVTQPDYAESECSDKYPCNEDIAAWEARIQVPDGFQATYFTRIDGKPTVMTFGPDGLIYIATLDGHVLTVDSSGQVATVLEGLLWPTGLAFQPGTNNLYISSRVSNEGVGGEAQISLWRDGQLRQIVGGLPCCYTSLHAANGIAFGPDGYGYVGVGGRADHGEILLEGPDQGKQDELQPLEAAIVRFSPDGSEVSAYARGLRNSYDLAWDANGRLYATDNSPDFGPPDELNLVEPGKEYGYPWFDCGSCFSPPPGVEITPPIYEFVPHSAPTGVTTYLAEQFPGFYNGVFAVLWSAFPGAQKVVYFDEGGINATDFAMGFAQPMDVAVGPEGSLYVVDHATGIIFRIDYVGQSEG